MARVILHLDLDAFFCAVEEQRDPALKGKAFAVGGRPDQRGVVASCSYPARQFGVHSAMPMSQAVKRCPGLIIVPSRHGAYSDVSGRVMAKLNALTPLVEQISIDEAFLDITGIAGAGEALARRLQAEINRDLELPCSLGVASNKLVAKIANNMGKSRQGRGAAPPNAIEIVPAGAEAAYLAPLSIRELWGVGPKTAERLAEFGVTTIGALARFPQSELVRLFGRNGEELAMHARGIDDRPVTPEHETKSISKETTFTQDVGDGDELRRTLARLAEGVGWQLRKEGLAGSTVRIKLRWSDFTTLTRQITLPNPIDQDDEITAMARALFDKHWPPNRPVRLIGVGVSGFEHQERQLGLWDTPRSEQQRRLQEALDSLRDRFGQQVIKRGRDLDLPPDDAE
jgi:DNA polymerase-4